MMPTPRFVSGSSERPASRSDQVRIVASGLFNSCATPDTVWPSAASFSLLQQVVIHVAVVIRHPAALGHVPEQGVDARRSGIAGGKVCRDLDPDRLVVGPAQPERIVGHGAVALQPLDEPAPRLGMDEPVVVEGTDLVVGGFRGEAEHQLQVRIGAEGHARAATREHPEIDALVCSFRTAPTSAACRTAGGVCRAALGDTADYSLSGDGLWGRELAPCRTQRNGNSATARSWSGGSGHETREPTRRFETPR